MAPHTLIKQPAHIKVIEIFSSFQGEGLYTGCPAVFLRLGECNLRCAFCDTPKPSPIHFTPLELLDQVNMVPCPRLLVITGGEPALQLHTEWLKLLAGRPLHLETNGSVIPIQGWELITPYFEHITCSPKVGLSSTAFSPFVDYTIPTTSPQIVTLKFIILPTDTMQSVRVRVEYCTSKGGASILSPLFFQPVHTDDGPDPDALQMALECAQYYRGRVSLQLHKFARVR